MAKRPRKRIFDLVGESRYQGALGRCSPGTTVSLVREPENPHDPNAIAVKAAGEIIGYIAAKDAADLAPALDEGGTHQAIVHEITGCLPDFPTIGCRVALQWHGDQPRKPKPLDPAQTAFRQKAQVGAPNGKSGCMGILAAILIPVSLAATALAQLT